MEKMAAPELTAPLATLAPMRPRGPPFCHRRISVPAPLHRVIVVPKDNLDHLAKADHLDRLAPMAFSHHLDRRVHLGQQVQTAKVDPKVPQVTQANRCRAQQVRKVHPARQDPLVNQVQVASQVATANQAHKVPQVLKVIAVPQAIQEIQAAQASLATLATKDCRDRAPNARRLVWLQAISEIIPPALDLPQCMKTLTNFFLPICSRIRYRFELAFNRSK